MSVISEKRASDILDLYVQDLLSIGSDSLLAVYAIGSLGGGYYRPGQSDIDAVLLFEDGSEHCWGTGNEPCEALKQLNKTYLETYEIPKDFGPISVQEGQLLPPYDPEDELVPEIARLKLQGKCVYGGFDLDAVPMPSASDYLRHVQHFEEWFRDRFLRSASFDTLSARGCVNTLLMHLHRFLWIKRGVVEFDKRKLATLYLAQDPPLIDRRLLDLGERSLSGETLAEEIVPELRQRTERLRIRVNHCLGIVL